MRCNYKHRRTCCLSVFFAQKTAALKKIQATWFYYHDKENTDKGAGNGVYTYNYTTFD